MTQHLTKEKHENQIHLFKLLNANVGFSCEQSYLAQHILNFDAANKDYGCVTHFRCANTRVCHDGSDKQFINVLGRIWVMMKDDDIPLVSAKLLKQMKYSTKALHSLLLQLQQQVHLTEILSTWF